MATNKVKPWHRALLAMGIVASFVPAAGAQSISRESRDSVARARVLIARLQQAPADASIQNESRTIGIELLRETRYEAAVDLFMALREAVPSDPAALYGGALALFNLRRLAEAEVWARAAVEKSLAGRSGTLAPNTSPIFGSPADTLVLVGIILAVKGDNAGSLAALTRAVEIAPGNFDAQLALGRALYGAGDPPGAARAFRAAVALRPTDTETRFFLCTALEKAGDDVGALAAYRELIAVAPNVAKGHLGLGVLLVKQGGAAENGGIRELQKALALDDKLYEGHVTLGRALIRARRETESIEHLKRAAELAPDNPEPHYQLAIAYRRLGRREEADIESAIVERIHQSRRGAQTSKAEESAPPRRLP
jgi:Flp pilus assembly protein TadD